MDELDYAELPLTPEARERLKSLDKELRDGFWRSSKQARERFGSSSQLRDQIIVLAAFSAQTAVRNYWACLSDSGHSVDVAANYLRTYARFAASEIREAMLQQVIGQFELTKLLPGEDNIDAVAEEWCEKLIEQKRRKIGSLDEQPIEPGQHPAFGGEGWQVDLELAAELNELRGEYLPRIAESARIDRFNLICALAAKIYDAVAQRRLPLVKAGHLEDISGFYNDQAFHPSIYVFPNLSGINLDQAEVEAVEQVVAGRRSYWFAQAIKRANRSPVLQADEALETLKRIPVQTQPAGEPSGNGEAKLKVDAMATASRHDKVLHSARLFVCPRLDILVQRHPPEMLELDKLLDRLEHPKIKEFPNEQAASDFYDQNLGSHTPPVYRCARHDHAGAPFTGTKFSQYRTKPSNKPLAPAMNFVLKNPVRCALAKDWRFRTMEGNVDEKPSDRSVWRHPQQPDVELLEALYDFESELYRVHSLLDLDALKDFWRSFEIHVHLTKHALKMQRYGREYARPVSEALVYVREHLTLYVEDVLTSAAAPADQTEGYVETKLLQQIKATPRKKRGRPTEISDELKQRALAVRGGKARAQILYNTKYPTPQQVKNVSSILRHHTGKRQPNQS